MGGVEGVEEGPGISRRVTDGRRIALDLGGESGKSILPQTMAHLSARPAHGGAGALVPVRLLGRVCRAGPATVCLPWTGLRGPPGLAVLGLILRGLPGSVPGSRDPCLAVSATWMGPMAWEGEAAPAAVVTGSRLWVREVVPLGMGSTSGGDVCRAGLPGGSPGTQATG